MQFLIPDMKTRQKKRKKKKGKQPLNSTTNGSGVGEEGEDTLFSRIVQVTRDSNYDR